MRREVLAPVDVHEQIASTLPWYRRWHWRIERRLLGRWAIRLCDTAIKTTNGSTEVRDYVADDDVLAELV